jgi:hypothetical protein
MRARGPTCRAGPSLFLFGRDAVNFEPTPKQALCLIGMLFGQNEQEREPLQSRVRPELSPEDRTALVQAGLLETERRGRGIHLLATDAAWKWASEHLDMVLPLSPAAGPILANVLSTLGQFLDRRGLVLADLVLQGAQPVSSPPVSSAPVSSAARFSPIPPRPPKTIDIEQASAEVRGRICNTLLGLAGGRSRRRVRLAELRDRLPEVPRRELDALLLELQSEQQLVLYRLDNPAELAQADHEAALLVGGNPRHLVYMEG